jgi:phosphonate transport system substrate-binding protein
MRNKRFTWSIAGLLLLLLALAACQPTPAEVTRVVTEIQTAVPQVQEIEIEVEVTRVVEIVQTAVPGVIAEQAPLGSAERPIKVLFVPSVEAAVIVSGGEVMAAALQEATGLHFVVSVPTSYAATVEEMCASPDDTIGFIPAQGYVLANDRCGVTVGGAAVRRGLSWYTAMFVVPIDSDIETLEDLAGKSWAIPDFASTSGYLYPYTVLWENDIEPGDIVETGSHNNAVLAVYNDEVDFATAFFSPPVVPGRDWIYGVDDPELWRDMNEAVVRNDSGHALVGGGVAQGGYRILDARASVTDIAPDIFEKTRILALTPQIPNDTVSFGPDFPLSLAQRIVDALVDFTQSEACAQSICSQDFYSWTGIEPVGDRFYDPVRSAMQALGITEADILR